MKRVFLTAFVFMVAMSLVLFSLTKEAAAEKNLLLNPSFEEGDHIDYWINDGNTTFNWVADWHPKEGKWSFGVGNDWDWAREGDWGRCLQVICDPKNPDNLYKVFPGKCVTFKMWMMGEKNYKGKASLKLEFFGYDRRLGLTDEPLASFQSKVHTGGFDWLQETVSGVAPRGTVSVVVSGISKDMPKGPKSSYVWFDNASVTVGPVM